jgi:hypothetical protein
MTLVVNSKQGPHGTLLIVTDNDIMGKTYTEGKKILDLTKKFYSGEVCDVDQVKLLLEEAQHIHLTGEEAVQLGISLQLINKERILYVASIPHAECVTG